MLINLKKIQQQKLNNKNECVALCYIACVVVAVLLYPCVYDVYLRVLWKMINNILFLSWLCVSIIAYLWYITHMYFWVHYTHILLTFRVSLFLSGYLYGILRRCDMWDRVSQANNNEDGYKIIIYSCETIWKSEWNIEAYSLKV